MTKIDSLSVGGASGATSEKGMPLAPSGKAAVAVPTQTKPGAELVALQNRVAQRANASFRQSGAPDVPQHQPHNPAGLAQLANGVIQHAGREAEKVAGVAKLMAEVTLEASRKV
ncbi:hypothetical protein [Paraburkholderia agricolaris]|uniref:hypothetical protein n=1 Tax=Paraburkholderia agricolaris TaxID=2152888 RepID=UPI001292B6B5|nr:hypothetical protein [Paraburkholderia agricolaris]